jgi:exonuclease III
MVNTIVRGGEGKKEEEKQVRSDKSLNIVHQNIRSLWRKCEELEILLATELYNAEVLCFTEHWLNWHKVHAVNINNFTLVSAFCRKNSDYGGSCIYVEQGIMTKELNFINNLGKEKSIELSAIEIVKYGIIVICIYRSPDGQIDTLFNKLEMIIKKLIEKHKTLILCGDWNINLLQSSPHAKELNNLFVRYNLKSIVNVHTRITKTTASLLDIVITNEEKYMNSLRVIKVKQSHYRPGQALMVPGG